MAKKTTSAEAAIAEKLEALWNLQQCDSEVDRIRTIRGELPLEVEDLEDELQGLETRLEKVNNEISEVEESIQTKKNMIKDAEAMITKYKGQQDNVRNNREFESLAKEIEYQELEIQLCEKKIREDHLTIERKKENKDAIDSNLGERKKDLEAKKGELESIINETKKEEEKLVKESEKARKEIDDRLLTAYDRLRDNSKNGLAVVSIEREACGGCHNRIPPQRQMDIYNQKKVIVCEHCGRILVDKRTEEEILASNKPKRRRASRAKKTA